MNVSVYDGRWHSTQTLSDALPKKVHCINVVGAGGKTTIIDSLAKEYRAKDLKTVIATTTHQYVPVEYDCTGDDYDKLQAMLQREKIAVIGTLCDGKESGKITVPNVQMYGKANSLSDFILVEADGSRQMPVKYPNVLEPVLTKDCELCLIVAGLSAIGQPFKDCCHRYELAMKKRCNDWNNRTIVDENDIVWLIKHGYIQRLKSLQTPPALAVILHQADTLSLREKGRQIIENLMEDGELQAGMVTSIRS